MPALKHHCKSSEKRTGKTYEDLHIWMDKPGEILEIDHRRVRHDLSYLEEVREKWGVEGVREFLRHISEDYLDTAEKWGKKCATPNCPNDTFRKHKYCNSCIKERKKIPVRLTKPTCEICGKQIDNGKKLCLECWKRNRRLR